MKLLKVLLCLPVLLSFCYSQSNEYTSSLDSLMSKDLCVEIEIDLFQLDSIFSGNTTLEIVKEIYLNVLVDSNSVINADEQYLIRYVNFCLQQKNRFSVKKAGQLSYSTYQDFLTLIDRKAYRDALKSYLYAYYFKVMYLEKIEYLASNLYAAAVNCYRIRNYDSSIQNLLYFQALTDSIDSDKFNKSEVSALKRKVESDIRKRYLFNKIWKEKIDYFNYFNISVGIGVLQQGALHQAHFDVFDFSSNEKYNLTLTDLASRYRPILTIFAEQRLRSHLLLGINYQYSSLNYNSEFLDQLAYFNFNVPCHSSAIYLKYLFRESRLRPYITFGTGGIYYLLGDEIIISTESYDGERFIYYLKSDDKFIKRLLYSLGFDYTTSPESKIIFNMFITLFQNENNDVFIQSSNFTFGTNIGYKF